MTSVRFNPRARGLTLIELVLVLAILSTVAGLVIPQVANLGRSSDMAASAKTQADLANNIQLHFLELKRFPQGMDSLLVGTGGTPTGVFLAQDLDGDGAQDTGLPDSGPHLDDQLTMTNLSTLDTGGSQFVRSLQRSGFDFVFDHDASVPNSNDSGTTQRNLTGSGIQVATILTGSDIAEAIFASTNGVIPSDIVLVAMGVGPRNSLLGKTAMNAPIYPGNDGSYYGRYVAIFKVYADGRRAQLAMVTDSYGRFPDYTIKQYNETLPEGARRG
jgi:prepilin-type N-terminal cleavage/methylation domain-containing protein